MLTTAALSAMGITDEERSSLAGIYSAGQTLWRVPISHFSAQDFNWRISFGAGARLNPKLKKVKSNTNNREKTVKCGSIIECEDQVLGERLPIAGTGFSLNYRSDRVPGRISNWLKIPLTEDTITDLQDIAVEIRVAGRVNPQNQPPS